MFAVLQTAIFGILIINFWNFQHFCVVICLIYPLFQLQFVSLAVFP
jgi:hypothetical protein